MYPRKTLLTSLRAWFDVRGRRAGSWAFALNRLTGLGLVAYLLIHLVVLQSLTRGPDGWNAFIAIARMPAVLLLDVVLIFGLLFHALNGVRVTLVGLGIAVGRQRQLLLGLLAVGALLLAISTWLIFTK